MSTAIPIGFEGMVWNPVPGLKVVFNTTATPYGEKPYEIDTFIHNECIEGNLIDNLSKRVR